MITASPAVGKPPQGGRGRAGSELVRQTTRIYIDARDVDNAENMYRPGRKPWEFPTGHGPAEAQKHVEPAKAALTGYVANYAGDYKKALEGGHRPPASFARRFRRSKG